MFERTIKVVSMVLALAYFLGSAVSVYFIIYQTADML